MSTNIPDKSIFKAQMIAAATGAILQYASTRTSKELLLGDQRWIAEEASRCIEIITAAFAQKDDYFQTEKSAAPLVK